MIYTKPFYYKPKESEFDLASKSYLISIFALVTGIPLPITNLIASILFIVLNRKASFFVRWHCTQVLLAQIVLFFINSSCFWWGISIFLKWTEYTNTFIFYLSFVLLINLIELFQTIYTTIKITSKKHIRWVFFAPLTDFFFTNSIKSYQNKML